MHGGDVYRNKVKIDFSVNVNPYTPPLSTRIALWKGLKKSRIYPDYKYEKLTNLYIKENGNMAGLKVLFANGVSEFIKAIIWAFDVKKALLLSPSYEGFRTALEEKGASITYVKTNLNKGIDERCKNEIINKASNVDVFFLSNPNNPDGHFLELGDLEEILESIKSTLVVIDESFVDLGNSISYIHCINDNPNVIILNSVTKSLGFPGIRAAYMYTLNSEIASTVRRTLPEWNLSTLGEIALKQKIKKWGFILNCNYKIRKERDFLYSSLCFLGLKVYPSDSNFILFEAYEGLKDDLLKQGILIRDCSDYVGLRKGFYRVGVLTHRKNLCLIKALRKLSWKFKK